jgi:hypothetical protein
MLGNCAATTVLDKRLKQVGAPDEPEPVDSLAEFAPDES